MKKSNYDGVIGWVKYIIDYPYNKIDLELLDGERKENQKERQRLNKKINNEVINRKIIEQEKDSLIQLLEKRIQVLGKELASTKKRNNELRNTVAVLYNQNENLEIEVERKELLRRKAAGAIGGYTKEINRLKQELEKANHKINWLSNNQKAPTKEEIIAYETRMREVEKRNKHGRTNNNI